jgi:hypothetical protein
MKLLHYNEVIWFVSVLGRQRFLNTKRKLVITEVRRRKRSLFNSVLSICNGFTADPDTNPVPDSDSGIW